jgi:Tfp pilus assembly protein PilF
VLAFIASAAAKFPLSRPQIGLKGSSLVSSRRTWYWRLLALWTVGIFTSLGAGLVLAQATDNDYYTTADTTLLRTVERYHVLPAEEKIRTKFYSAARSDIDFVLRYFPNHPKGLLLMAQLCTDHAMPHCELDSVFEKAIALNPNVAGTYVTQGVYLHRVKRYREAIASYQRALAIDPDSINGHYNLALAYLETKQYDLANEEAQRAYALGAPLPGLRDRLKQSGRWKPVAATPAPQSSSAAADSGGATTAPDGRQSQ